MKKIIFFLFFISVFFLFQACQRTADRFEPNDSFNQAKRIKLGKDLKMSIYPKRDIDFFKFTIDSPGVIGIEYDINKPTNIKLIATIYDSDTNILISNERIPFKITLDKGEYFISVQDDLNDEESPQFFNLRINYYKVNLDKYEPNDKLEQAKVVKVNESIKINIFPKGDRESFKVKSPNAGYLSFSYGEDKPVNINLSLNFHDLDGEFLKGPVTLPAEIPVAEGVYAFVLFDQDDQAESENLFQVNLSFTPVSLDKYEPNDSFSQAKEITLSEVLDINLFPQGDVDIFKFQLKQSSVLELLKEFGKDKGIIDVKTNIHDNFGNTVLNNKSIPLEIELAPGIYYIEFFLQNQNTVYPEMFKIKINQIRK